MADAGQLPIGWRDLAEAVPGSVGIHVNGEFVYVSTGFGAAVGVGTDALVGEHWSVLFDRDEAARFGGEVIERARSEGQWEGEVRTGGRHAGGATVDLTLSSAGRDTFVWVVTDRGPARGDDRSIARGSRSRVRPDLARNVLDAIDDVVYVTDGDGRLRLWNRALAETTGYGHGEIERIGPRELVADRQPGNASGPDDRPRGAGPGDLREDVSGTTVDADGGRRREIDVLTRDGERIPHEARETRVEDPATGQTLRCVVARDVSERRAREDELRRQRTLIQAILNTVPDVIFAYDEDGEHIVEEALLDEFAGYPKEELAEMELLDFLPEEDRAAARERFRRARVDEETVTYETEIVTKEGTSTPHEYRAAPMELDGETLGLVAAARDITERLKRERALERQRDELATLDRINELLLETVRELVQTSSRDAVERTVCERLVASDLYQFAWIGERRRDGDRIVPRVTAGEDHGYLDAVTITDDRSETGRGPAGRAMRTGRVQVANVADPAFEPWRDAAVERGFESVAAVPLHRGETVYGVLAVYATREDAFREREQAGFDVLGRTVGSVIHAARSRELLFADAVVELEFDLVGVDPVFPAVAADLDCEISLEGYVSSGAQWVLYLTVDGRPAGAVAGAAADSAGVERARVVSEDDDGGRVELVVRDSSLLQAMSALGATVKTAASDGDGGRLVIEAPVDADVRSLVEHVLREYPGAELVARHEREREVTTIGRPDGVLDDLTDRQREVLETAYRAGYFGWPRDSTAEEVAEALEIAAPTLHGHLRKAEEALLAELF